MNPKILIISAPFAQDRRMSALKYAEGTGLAYEVLQGVNGDNLNLDAIPRIHTGMQFNTRIIACYLSHIHALTIAAEHKQPCIIVEDDWKPIRPVLQSLETMPETDYAVLHGLDMKEASAEVALVSGSWELLTVPPVIALGYIPGPRFIECALGMAFPIMDHVDHFYRKLFFSHRLTACRPRQPIITGAGFSSTLGH